MEVLKIENLSKSFKDIEAVKDINLSINENEVVSIVGPSGSGKSTLLRLICNLEKTDMGSIKILDYYVLKNGKYDKKNLAIYSEVGMIFQDFNLFDNLNVLENIQLAPKVVKKLSAEELDHLTMRIIKQVNLEDKLSAYPSNLSGGQKQRIAIARCLAMNPKIILIDEPTSSLDVEAVDNLVDCINDLKKQKITMLIVTHDIDFAKRVSTHLYFMENSQIQFKSLIEDLSDIKDERIMKFINKK